MKKAIAFSSIIALTSAISSASAAPRDFYRESPSCGDRSSAYLCITLRKGGDTGLQYISNFKADFTGPGIARVSWRGTLSCEVDAERIDGAFTNSVLEYYMNLALKDDRSPIDFNSPGSVAAGERLSVVSFISSPNSSVSVGRRNLLIPVNVDRTFKIKASDKSKVFRLAVLPDWRGVLEGSCRLYGGVIGVDYKGI